MIIKLTHAHVIGTIIAYIFGVFLVPMVISYSKREIKGTEYQGVKITDENK